MNTSQRQLDIESAESRLNTVREKRGYLMPHHGLLALTAPELLQGYDACYSALTLGNRYLAEKDKEFIWLGILAVKEEFLATQHVAKYLTRRRFIGSRSPICENGRLCTGCCSI